MYLGLDLGTSAVKALLADETGMVIGSRSASLAVSRPQAGWSEQDPQQWWQATCAAATALAGDFPSQMAAVRAIGLSGQMHGLTALDAADQVIRPCILWNDTRAAAQAEHMDSTMPLFRGIGGNAVMPGFTAPKAVWMAENEPDGFARIATVLLPKDYLRFRMCGERMSDMSDSAGTLWMDVAARGWSDALLEACGLTRSQMPGLVEGGAPAGRLRADLAREWGIDGTPVIAGGGGDNAAAAVGLGVTAPGDAFLSLGTSGVVFAVTDSFAPAAESGAHAFCHAVEDTWHQMGVILAASDCVAWLCEVTGADVETLMADLAAHPLEATDVLHRAGGVPSALLATGGGAKNAGWLSYIAAVTGLPITLPVDGDFGAALGAARLGMMADGMTKDEICHTPRIREEITPDAALADLLAPARETWQDIYRVLKGVRDR